MSTWAKAVDIFNTKSVFDIGSVFGIGSSIALVVVFDVTFGTTKVIVDAFTFPSKVDSELSTWTKAAGVFGLGNSITFVVVLDVTFGTTKVIVDAFTFSSKVDSELSARAQAAGFLHFSVTLQGRNLGVEMVFCRDGVSIASQLELKQNYLCLWPRCTNLNVRHR